MGPINPTAEQVKALVEGSAQDPVVMVNLLKFRKLAEGEAGTGAVAYARYSAGFAKLLEAGGGRLLWAGKVDQVFIGEPAEDWDLVAVVEYPSRRGFLELTSSPEYRKIHEHRTAGLERTILLACTTQHQG